MQIFYKHGEDPYLQTLGTTGVGGEGNHQFKNPDGIAVDPGPNGHIYVADKGNERVQEFTKAGAYVRTFGVTGQAGQDNAHFNWPMGVSVDPGPGGCVYVADSGNARIQIFSKEGVYVRTLNNQLREPHGVFAEPGPNGGIYVADTENSRVLVFSK